MRTIVASRNTATASPKPTNCIISTLAKPKAPKTRIMIRAAEVMTDAVAESPSIVASVFLPVRS